MKLPFKVRDIVKNIVNHRRYLIVEKHNKGYKCLDIDLDRDCDFGVYACNDWILIDSYDGD